MGEGLRLLDYRQALSSMEDNATGEYTCVSSLLRSGAVVRRDNSIGSSVMLNSMTAYGRHEGETVDGRYVWELKSVNNRYLDLQLRLPEECLAEESALRRRLSDRIRRGRVDVQLSLDGESGAADALVLDEQLLKQIGTAVSEASRLSGMRVRADALRLLQWPGVLRSQGGNRVRQRLADAALQGFDAAIDDFHAARKREGQALDALLRNRIDAMHRHVAEVRARRPVMLAEFEQRYRRRFQELMRVNAGAEIDDRRLEQELVLLVQKLDVDEELDRLGAHLDEIVKVLARDEPVGRRLDFLLQEMNREANTLGAKSSDSETTSHCIDLKVLIEQLREQVQNVE